MKLKICKLHPDAQQPTYGTPGAACFDLHTVHGGEVGVYESRTFGTGLAFEIPEGHVLLVFSRSGHGFKHGLRLSNCVGVIDSDYRGELKVQLRNDTAIRFGFEPGDRVAQAMVVPVPQVEFSVVEQLTITERGQQGFGSTGA
jgi:dUTP pyrophosphatase